MNTQPYNKPTLGGTIPFAAASQQPLGVACNDMDWNRYFTYDGSAGMLIRKSRPLSDFSSLQGWASWTARFAGKYAGVTRTPMRRGAQVRVEGILFLVHRIIWEMHNGSIPEEMQIDHINGDPWDNRLSNLRLVTPSQNTMNTRCKSTNVSRLKGVGRMGKKWRARIGVNGATIALGVFDTKEEAALARNAAAMKYHGEFSDVASR